MQDRIQATIASLREAFEADGADLVLEAIEGDVVRVRLILRPNACKECILSTHILEGMLLGAIQQEEPRIGRVDLIDPRVPVTGDSN